MNDFSDTSSSEPLAVQTDAFLPLVLVSLSLAFVFIFQLSAITQQRTAFQNAIGRQGDGVKQSRAIQANLEKLVRDVMELAQSGDEDAKAIIQKYGVQANGPAPMPEK